MKVYSITSPIKLELASDLIKWERDRRKVVDIINAWLRGNEPKSVVLELGRNAHIFYTNEEGKKTLLATLYVIPARKFVKEEELTEI